ncbi:hypothetical protein EST38_g9379 [Candolleomyces aberdarensis]|uniref:Uncharacterized protein n=1 Tax=Candolleomyces aberdarensis TaxID=2316362 RepID=A0A4Q2DDB0_9AGAR|nr:hypothetical protein EST38_g9379 [Candolleomyces aberdarensis]
MTTETYNPRDYDTLPSLHNSATEFVKRDAEAVLDSDIRQLFSDFDVSKKYGVALLHKHFPIEPTQRLVEFHNTATPWFIKESKKGGAFPHRDGFIVPRAFRFDGADSSEAKPYEFSFTYEEPKPLTDTEIAFFKAFWTIIIGFQLQNVLGICTLGNEPEKDKYQLEITEGKANIMIKGDSVPSSSVIQAVWSFTPDANSKIVKRECISSCYAVDQVHGYAGPHEYEPDDC